MYRRLFAIAIATLLTPAFQDLAQAQLPDPPTPPTITAPSTDDTVDFKFTTYGKTTSKITQVVFYESGNPCRFVAGTLTEPMDPCGNWSANVSVPNCWPLSSKYVLAVTNGGGTTFVTNLSLSGCGMLKR